MEELETIRNERAEEVKGLSMDHLHSTLLCLKEEKEFKEKLRVGYINVIDELQYMMIEKPMEYKAYISRGLGIEEYRKRYNNTTADWRITKRQIEDITRQIKEHSNN
jgi:hypothetical protein